MKTETEQEPQRAGLEDVLLAILGLIAGPLLWWMSQSWNSQPTPSSIQTLEYWIALICGFIGVALATAWLIFLVAGAAFIVGVKTHRATLTYWSELFTPKFLRRILISVVGVQLALSSQAVAAPQQEDARLETPTLTTENAFMPHVEVPTAPSGSEIQDSFDSQPHNPLSEDNLSIPSASASRSPSSEPALSPKPRETSDIVASAYPTSSELEIQELVPTPRQTSTLPVDPDLLQEQNPRQKSASHQSKEFTPTPVPMPPHIGEPPNTNEPDNSTVAVKAGDCLWDIAHYELGADATLFQIDRRWRQWWEYNAAVIGEDPHTIRPGTILEMPPFTD